MKPIKSRRIIIVDSDKLKPAMDKINKEYSGLFRMLSGAPVGASDAPFVDKPSVRPRG